MEHKIVISSILCIAAYLLGAIPTSVWVGKIFYNTDIREHGSGNAGASNTFRILGVKAGIPVLLFDGFKGWLSVWLANLHIDISPGTDVYLNFQLLLGVISAFGHIFPVYVRFKGGKGVATLFGALLSMTPIIALSVLAVYLTILLTTRYPSLSSMLAGISFPILTGTVFSPTTLPYFLFSLSIAILLLITHKQNILRLFKGEEGKANLYGKWKMGKKTDSD